MTAKTTKKTASEPEVLCKNCDVTEPVQGDKNWFICHRYPQTIRVFHTHWCGEFKAK